MLRNCKECGAHADTICDECAQPICSDCSRACSDCGINLCTSCQHKDDNKEIYCEDCLCE